MVYLSPQNPKSFEYHERSKLYLDQCQNGQWDVHLDIYDI